MDRPDLPSNTYHSLSEEQAAFICSGLSITASSRDGRFIPSISRVLACAVNDSRNQLRIVVVKSQALQLLLDIKASTEIAVVFSQPSSHKTLQIKGKNTHQSDIQDGDIVLIDQCIRGFADNLASIGYPREFAHAFHHYSPDDVAAISFTPVALFEQSPGPDAGKALAFGS